MGHTYSCRTFLSKISTSQTCTTTPSTHLTPTTLTTHSTPLTPNTRPPPLMGVTPNGSHFFMSHFFEQNFYYSNMHVHPLHPPHPNPHNHPLHPKKCDTKKCDPLSNLHNKMGHTYSCCTFLSKISISQSFTINGSHLLMSHFLKQNF